ncbi:MAG: HK97 gp10 family phage protein [Brevundimonas sp.]
MARSRFRAGDRDRAKALLRSLPRKVRKATTTALDQSAEELTQIIKRAVPVDEGDLRDSIRWKRGKGAVTSRGQVVQEAGLDPDLTVRVIEGDEKTGYVYPVEFGAADRPAQPHFYPSWRANRKRLARKIKAAQRKAIREAAEDV